MPFFLLVYALFIYFTKFMLINTPTSKYRSVALETWVFTEINQQMLVDFSFSEYRKVASKTRPCLQGEVTQGTCSEQTESTEIV